MRRLPTSVRCLIFALSNALFIVFYWSFIQPLNWQPLKSTLEVAVLLSFCLMVLAVVLGILLFMLENL